LEFGVQFFPNVRPEQRSAKQYFSEALDLTGEAETVGYTHVRIVEHHFHAYGGYSPSPMMFLSAASQRTKSMRLITGAVLPVFNNPLRLAAEIAMLDGISGGRAEIGFARAFLPGEFERFGVSLDDSRARFDEGLEIVTKLLEGEQVSHDGAFISFADTTTLPRPTQQPRPPFWVAVLATPASFVRAGQLGHSIMVNPLSGDTLRGLIDQYHEAWQAAGNAGRGRVMLAVPMFCDEDEDRAVAVARDPLDAYFSAIAEAAGSWVDGTSSADYPGYDKIIAKLSETTFDTQMAAGVCWVGTPERIRELIAAQVEQIGPFDIASMQINFTDLEYEDARASMRLFAREVLPHFSGELAQIGS
jgi:alkanesulfonate monooxygenase SsuD/methylene tetrahydromethanopterin reductase-like flavin-dependent oxidoreductase (luciferase family)